MLHRLRGVTRFFSAGPKSYKEFRSATTEIRSLLGLQSTYAEDMVLRKCYDVVSSNITGIGLTNHSGYALGGSHKPALKTACALSRVLPQFVPVYVNAAEHSDKSIIDIMTESVVGACDENAKVIDSYVSGDIRRLLMVANYHELNVGLFLDELSASYNRDTWKIILPMLEDHRNVVFTSDTDNELLAAMVRGDHYVLTPGHALVKKAGEKCCLRDLNATKLVIIV